MADAQANGLKRSHPTDETYEKDGVQKRIRSSNGSPAPKTNGSSGSKPDVGKIMEQARARIAAAAARLQGPAAGASGTLPGSHSPSPGPAEGKGLSRMEQMKARVAATMAKSSGSASSSNPVPTYDDGISRARGGLSAALHPSLLDANQDARSSKNKQVMQPKFATTMANRRLPEEQVSKASKPKKQLAIFAPDPTETRSNPYFDASLGAQTATLKARNARQLKFNEKGKYIAQGSTLRRQLALEAMRKRIAISSSKAKLDDDPSEKNFVIESLGSESDREWWDEGLLDSYSELETGLQLDDKITNLIQHPILIAPPGHVPPPKPLPLTSKEQKKLRRQSKSYFDNH